MNPADSSVIINEFDGTTNGGGKQITKHFQAVTLGAAEGVTESQLNINHEEDPTQGNNIEHIFPDSNRILKSKSSSRRFSEKLD